MTLPQLLVNLLAFLSFPHKWSHWSERTWIFIVDDDNMDCIPSDLYPVFHPLPVFLCNCPV